MNMVTKPTPYGMHEIEGKTVLITGSTDGIGKQVALECASLGAHVILHGRNQDKLDQVQSELTEKTENNRIDQVIADMSSLDQIRQMSNTIHDHYDKIDIFILNAGAQIHEHTLSVDGFEMMFAVNHLAYFYITSLLLDLVQQSDFSRIIIVASASHSEDIDWKNVHGERNYEFFPMYMQSKFCNFLFTYKLARLLKGTSTTVNCLHPGLVNTNIDPLRKPEVLARAVPVDQGIKSVVYVATSKAIDGLSGYYFNQHNVLSVSRSKTYNKSLQEKLWKYSEELVGEKFKK